MKIVREYQELEAECIDVITAEYLEDYAIRIAFNDGSSRVVDFKPFLRQSVHPSIRKYLDTALFSKFKIVDGNINWNDYDMIFPVDDLYTGVI